MKLFSLTLIFEDNSIMNKLLLLLSLAVIHAVEPLGLSGRNELLAQQIAERIGEELGGAISSQISPSLLASHLGQNLERLQVPVMVPLERIIDDDFIDKFICKDKLKKKKPYEVTENIHEPTTETHLHLEKPHKPHIKPYKPFKPPFWFNFFSHPHHHEKTAHKSKKSEGKSTIRDSLPSPMPDHNDIASSITHRVKTIVAEVARDSEEQVEVFDSTETVVEPEIDPKIT